MRDVGRRKRDGVHDALLGGQGRAKDPAAFDA
jgi:hypothetical protein